MPSNLKKLIRARMDKTGESYQTAQRHVRAHGKDSEASGDLKLVLRPFHVSIEREGEPATELRGRIEGERFVVGFMGEEVSLPATEAGRDQFGNYVRVPECEASFSLGFKLRLEVDPDEPIVPGDRPTFGSAIVVYLEGRGNDVLRASLRASGVDPDSVNIVEPYERSYSVLFTSTGHVTGRSSSGPWRPSASGPAN